jgi:hypothetical protein
MTGATIRAAVHVSPEFVAATSIEKAHSPRGGRQSHLQCGRVAGAANALPQWASRPAGSTSGNRSVPRR